ncbi:MAG TPA: hypothetical protein VEK55_12200 [Xanthobacteraceae bacterium]|nr:hypothetical protein [Xanthobacteraceae bacterium]
MENGLRIVTCLLAAALFGVAGVGASLAEEAGAGAHDVGNVSNSPAEPSGSQPATAGAIGEGTPKLGGDLQAHSKGDSEGPQQGLDAAANSPGASGLGNNGGHAIDTSIGAPSRRLDGSRSGIQNVKARVRLLAPRRPSTPATLEQGVRNAIGVPVAPHGGLQPRDERRGVPTVVPNSPGSGVATSTKAEDHLERPAFVRGDTSAGLGANTSNRGMISGTGATHPGASPHSIGGPAKTVAGISGTSIHSKH